MRISPVRLPRLLGTLVIAFAPYEPLPLLRGRPALLRNGHPTGLSMGHRPGGGGSNQQSSPALVHDLPRRGAPLALPGAVRGAVCHRRRDRPRGHPTTRSSCLPLGVVLVLAGIATKWVAEIVLAVIGTRLLMIGRRALRSYRSEVTLTGRLPSASQAQMAHRLPRGDADPEWTRRTNSQYIPPPGRRTWCRGRSALREAQRRLLSQARLPTAPSGVPWGPASDAPPSPSRPCNFGQTSPKGLSEIGCISTTISAVGLVRRGAA